MDFKKIRNFCIIAHIDHGKSTLADRFLELTQTISKREIKEQVLDQLELEREKGITIKSKPVRMKYNSYILNLIDTPGHVDFTYEVSRSLACVEGAILLVDATQGIQAQTLANYYLAQKQNLTIIPVVNKIDLPNAQIKETKEALAELTSSKINEVLLISAKTGQGVKEVLENIIKKIPPPYVKLNSSFKALIFDSAYDEHLGVIAYVRVFEGEIKPDQRIYFLGSKTESIVKEVGIFKLKRIPTPKLSAGEIGYLITGLKDLRLCQVGDTIALSLEEKPLPGYYPLKPLVFASFFPQEADYPKLKEALYKLKLNDASLVLEKESSPVLGLGFRIGFLGLLHLEITKERLKRDYSLEVIITQPSVLYKVLLSKGEEILISSPLDLPPPEQIKEIFEPWMKLTIFTHSKFLGRILELLNAFKARYDNIEYLDQNRVVILGQIPLRSLIRDFYDKLKSVSSGYASLNYEFLEYRPTKIRRLDILIAGQKEEALATLVYESEAYNEGRRIVDRLKDVIPRQLFEVKIQAALGGRIIASAKIPPLRKDVTAKLYGGDPTRRMKLLAKQKRGKKRLKEQARLSLPPEVFWEIFRKG